MAFPLQADIEGNVGGSQGQMKLWGEGRKEGGVLLQELVSHAESVDGPKGRGQNHAQLLRLPQGPQ